MSLELNQETGEMLLSHYGNTFALGFKGDAGFIERCYNLAFNYSMTNGALIELSQSMSYILTNPVKIMQALKLYFYNEVIRNREVAVSFTDDGDIVVDEAMAEKLSLEKAQAFFDKKIRKENFMFNQYLNKIKLNADCDDGVIYSEK